MRDLPRATPAFVFCLLVSAPVLAETTTDAGATLTVQTGALAPDYPVLTRGQVVFANAQRFVVTQEPAPAARVEEPPPVPESIDAKRPTPPFKGAVWVEAHWVYGPTGYSWVAGRYVAPRVGHVFVPPRWASLDGVFFYFTGFYVPHGVYVRSFFNRYYFSGMPKGQRRFDQGPYWPIGAPTRANSALTSASARDPYWPIGVRR